MKLVSVVLSICARDLEPTRRFLNNLVLVKNQALPYQ